MKSCPFCAKEINAVAIVCKHCGRDVSGGTSVAAAPAPPPRESSVQVSPERSAQTRPRWIIWGLGPIALLLGVWAAYRARTGREEARAPVKISLANGQADQVPNRAYEHYDFTLPERNCAITGRIVGLTGGNNDFQAFLIDDENFRNWKANQKAQVYWQTDTVRVATIDARVSGPGVFHLVISNAFSPSTPKTVTVQAEADCP
ncbi:MAG TPA: hypothetical protein VLT79_08530 [Gemmatimonadales bacterium]|nr:hypothetical protein [Gemmatimonadales bacterium]